MRCGVCDAPHQREKEGQGYLGFRRDFDDGMMFKVTTNMETQGTLGPQLNHCVCWSLLHSGDSRNDRQTIVFFNILIWT